MGSGAYPSLVGILSTTSAAGQIETLPAEEARVDGPSARTEHGYAGSEHG